MELYFIRRGVGVIALQCLFVVAANVLHDCRCYGMCGHRLEVEMEKSTVTQGNKCLTQYGFIDVRNPHADVVDTAFEHQAFPFFLLFEMAVVGRHHIEAKFLEVEILLRQDVLGHGGVLGAIELQRLDQLVHPLVNGFRAFGDTFLQFLFGVEGKCLVGEAMDGKVCVVWVKDEAPVHLIQLPACGSECCNGEAYLLALLRRRLLADVHGAEPDNDTDFFVLRRFVGEQYCVDVVKCEMDRSSCRHRRWWNGRFQYRGRTPFFESVHHIAEMLGQGLRVPCVCCICLQGF